MSRHQRPIVISTATNPTIRLGLAKTVLLKKATAHTARLPRESEAAIGQIEGFKRWKGWRAFICRLVYSAGCFLGERDCLEI